MAHGESNQLSLSEDPQSMGRELARCFQVAMRVGRSHGWTNEASVGAIESLIRAINALVASRGEFGLHVAGDFLYLDDMRLRSDGLRHGSIETLVGEPGAAQGAKPSAESGAKPGGGS